MHANTNMSILTRYKSNFPLNIDERDGQQQKTSTSPNDETHEMPRNGFISNINEHAAIFGFDVAANGTNRGKHGKTPNTSCVSVCVSAYLLIRINCKTK